MKRPQPKPGYTVMLALYACAGMTSQEFADYWLDVHAPIAAEMPGVLDIQFFAVQRAQSGLGEPIDGFIALRFESEEAFTAAASTPEYQRSLDDTRFFARQITFHTGTAYQPVLGVSGAPRGG